MRLADFDCLLSPQQAPRGKMQSRLSKTSTIPSTQEAGREDLRGKTTVDSPDIESWERQSTKRRVNIAAGARSMFHLNNVIVLDAPSDMTWSRLSRKHSPRLPGVGRSKCARKHRSLISCGLRRSQIWESSGKGGSGYIKTILRASRAIHDGRLIGAWLTVARASLRRCISGAHHPGSAGGASSRMSGRERWRR